MIEIDFQRYNAADELHLMAAAMVSGWSKGMTAMQPIEPGDISGYPCSILAFSEDASLLGHVAVVTYEEGSALVGGLVVNPVCRGRGVGQQLVRQIIHEAGKEFPDMRECKALANYSSLKLFQQAGGLFVGFREPTRRGGNWIVSLTSAVRSSRETPAASK